jgi:hypothetical protein
VSYIVIYILSPLALLWSVVAVAVRLITDPLRKSYVHI